MSEIQLNDPQTLYRRWEDSQWNPFEIDLDARPEQWAAMRRRPTGLVYWALSSLMVAEERITTKFSGLVGAYGTEEEATFLVDPAGRRGAAHAVLRPLPGRGRSPRRPRSPPTSSGPGSRSRPPSARSSTRRWSRPTSALVAAPGDLPPRSAS